MHTHSRLVPRLLLLAAIQAGVWIGIGRRQLLLVRRGRHQRRATGRPRHATTKAGVRWRHQGLLHHAVLMVVVVRAAGAMTLW
jgi:hypothetical protein